MLVYSKFHIILLKQTKFDYRISKFSNFSDISLEQCNDTSHIGLWCVFGGNKHYMYSCITYGEAN